MDAATDGTPKEIESGFGALFAAASARCLAAHPDTEPGHIFNSCGLSTSGKFFAVQSRDDLLLKLPASRVVALVAGGDGRAFEAGRRTMREWVCVSPAGEDACLEFMEEARQFVAGPTEH